MKPGKKSFQPTQRDLNETSFGYHHCHRLAATDRPGKVRRHKGCMNSLTTDRPTCDIGSAAYWAVALGLGCATYARPGATRREVSNKHFALPLIESIYSEITAFLGVTPAEYERAVAMVAEPAQKLGLHVTFTSRLCYSARQAQRLSAELRTQLCAVNARLAWIFDFVRTINGLLLGYPCQVKARALRERQAETAAETAQCLTETAQNAAMLDEYSSQFIRRLSGGEIEPQTLKEEQARFMRWAHERADSTWTNN